MRPITPPRGPTTRGRVIAVHPNPHPNRLQDSMNMGAAAASRPMPTTQIPMGPGPAGLANSMDGPDYDASPGAPY